MAEERLAVLNPISGAPTQALQLASATAVRKELGLVAPDDIIEGVVLEREDPELVALAERQTMALITLPTANVQIREEARERSRTAVANMGRTLQVESAHQSKMLQQPVKKIAQIGRASCRERVYVLV